MKKILIIAICTFCTLPVMAYIEPQWVDFCPYAYRNIDTSKTYKVPIKKYWASRKITFDKNVSFCNSLEVSEKSKCFEELRKVESEKTNVAQRQQMNNAIYSLYTLKY